MKFMVIRKADAETEAFAMPTPQLIDDMQSYNESMVKAGVMKQGDGLMPSARGARVSFANGKPTVLDGKLTYQAVAEAHGLEYTPLDDVLPLTAA